MHRPIHVHAQITSGGSPPMRFSTMPAFYFPLAFTAFLLPIGIVALILNPGPEGYALASLAGASGLTCLFMTVRAARQKTVRRGTIEEDGIEFHPRGHKPWRLRWDDVQAVSWWNSRVTLIGQDQSVTLYWANARSRGAPRQWLRHKLEFAFTLEDPPIPPIWTKRSLARIAGATAICVTPMLLAWWQYRQDPIGNRHWVLLLVFSPLVLLLPAMRLVGGPLHMPQEVWQHRRGVN